MQTRDKWIIIIMIIVMISTGISYYAIAQNQTTNTPTTIIVNGDGSSGTGNVTNTKIVTQVVQVTGSQDTEVAVYGGNDTNIK